MSHFSNAIDSKKNIRIDMKINDIKTLIEISQLSKEVCSKFGSKYGRMLDLLHIPVEALDLSALTQYCNSNLRCFEFSNLDATSTIEEYAQMIRIPLPKELHVYLYYGQHVSGGKVAKLLGIQPKPSDEMEKGAFKGLKKRFLKVYLSELARQ